MITIRGGEMMGAEAEQSNITMFKRNKMKKIRVYNQKLEHFCYLRWLKAQGTRFELFWINMFGKAGNIKPQKKL